MSYALHPYSAATYGGARPSTGGATVDPSRPALGAARWATQTGPGALGQTAYAGGGLAVQALTAELDVWPDPSTGTVRLSAFWAGADYLRLVRVTGQARTPVRGAYPVTIPTKTRYNRMTNPSAEVDLGGWLAGANTTMTRRVEEAMLAGVACVRLTADTAGAVGATLPVSLPTTGPVALSLGLRFAQDPTGPLTATARWFDDTGAEVGTTTASLPAAALAQTYRGRWDRTPDLVLAPFQEFIDETGAGAVTVANGVLSVGVDGLAAGDTADLDVVLVESGTATGPYFDGDFAQAVWLGDPHASASALAAEVGFVDPEAPLDVPFHYELTSNQVGYRLSSEVVEMRSGGRSWISHPDGTVLPLHVTAAPDLTRSIKRGLYEVYDRAAPIAVSANIRQAPAGSMVVYVGDHGVRDRLLDLLADGQPVLARFPADLGYGPGLWVSVGEVGEAAPGHGAWGSRRLTLPFQVVDEPVVI